jgi:A/G-specific adenine glycosylase
MQKSFQQILINWYSKNGRDLPWRRTRDPYSILVSELMLQQTQVATVLPYYDRWLHRFPNFDSLARASETEVLHAWQGLGYYARARNLHAAAKIVQHRHRGIFPRELDAIRNLPGVGRYTANAVATFAFNQSVPIVEANTSRVIARLFNVTQPIDSTAGREALWNFANELVPSRGAYRFNSALMDLGAIICLPKPKCAICPVKKFCRATNAEILPRKKPRPVTKQLFERHAFVRRNGTILLQRAEHRWRGMWILPNLKVARSNRSSLSGAIYKSVFPFTNHRITLQIFGRRFRKIDNQHQRWFSKRELGSIPIPSPHRRAIEQLLTSA